MVQQLSPRLATLSLIFPLMAPCGRFRFLRGSRAAWETLAGLGALDIFRTVTWSSRKGAIYLVPTQTARTRASLLLQRVLLISQVFHRTDGE